MIPELPSVEALAEAMYSTAWPVASIHRPWYAVSRDAKEIWLNDAAHLRRSLAVVLLFDDLRTSFQKEEAKHKLILEDGVCSYGPTCQGCDEPDGALSCFRPQPTEWR